MLIAPALISREAAGVLRAVSSRFTPGEGGSWEQKLLRHHSRRGESHQINQMTP